MRADLAPPRKYKRSETHYTLSKKLLYLSLVTFCGENLLWGSEKSLSWQHCAHLNYSPLSLSDCSSTRDVFSDAHTRAGISGQVRPRIFFSRTLEKLGRMYGQLLFFFCSVAWVHPKSTSYPSS